MQAMVHSAPLPFFFLSDLKARTVLFVFTMKLSGPLDWQNLSDDTSLVFKKFSVSQKKMRETFSHRWRRHHPCTFCSTCNYPCCAWCQILCTKTQSQGRMATSAEKYFSWKVSICSSRPSTVHWLSSSIFPCSFVCLLSVCPATVTSDQISTFFNMYRHKSLVLTQFD